MKVYIKNYSFFPESICKLMRKNDLQWEIYKIKAWNLTINKLREETYTIWENKWRGNLRTLDIAPR